MRRLARRVLLIVVPLLSSVGTASAERAGVLWGQPYPPVKEFVFLRVDAFELADAASGRRTARLR
jgi:hypothetical protein